MLGFEDELGEEDFIFAFVDLEFCQSVRNCDANGKRSQILEICTWFALRSILYSSK